MKSLVSVLCLLCALATACPHHASDFKGLKQTLHVYAAVIELTVFGVGTLNMYVSAV